MIKVFDHWKKNKGWMEFSDYEAAKKYVEETFFDYWCMDKDNSCECYMEIYNDGDYEIWCAEMDGWLGCTDEDGPHFLVYNGSKSDFVDVTFTTLNPRADYILI